MIIIRWLALLPVVLLGKLATMRQARLDSIS